VVRDAARSHTEKDPSGSPRAAREGVGCEKLVALLEASPAVRAFVGENIRLFNGKPGDSQSMDLLDALLADQAYRAAYWRGGRGDQLPALSSTSTSWRPSAMDGAPGSSRPTHRTALPPVRDGAVTGLRIDHPDGLYDPADYLRRLQEGAGGEIYVVAEKILAPGSSCRTRGPPPAPPATSS